MQEAPEAVFDHTTKASALLYWLLRRNSLTRLETLRGHLLAAKEHLAILYRYIKALTGLNISHHILSRWQIDRAH